MKPLLCMLTVLPGNWWNCLQLRWQHTGIVYSSVDNQCKLVLQLIKLSTAPLTTSAHWYCNWWNCLQLHWQPVHTGIATDETVYSSVDNQCTLPGNWWNCLQLRWQPVHTGIATDKTVYSSIDNQCTLVLQLMKLSTAPLTTSAHWHCKWKWRMIHIFVRGTQVHGVHYVYIHVTITLGNCHRPAQSGLPEDLTKWNVLIIVYWSSWRQQTLVSIKLVTHCNSWIECKNEISTQNGDHLSMIHNVNTPIFLHPV